MNCKTMLFLSLVFPCAMLGAKDFAPVKTGVGQIQVYQPERFSIRQGATISNELASYQLTLTQSKSDGTRMPENRFTLSAGEFGFCRMITFFKLTVNGIVQKDISPKVEDLTEWKEGNLAGCELKMNFDGAKMLLRLYMRPDSPVLWGVLTPTRNGAGPIEKIEAEFCAIPSMLVKEGNTPVWGNKGMYSRTAITPTRTIPQNPKRVQLTPADTYVILQDDKFDGSAPDKGQGPCMVILPDYSSFLNASVRVNDDWTSGIYLILKPDFKNFEFGVWQQKPRISNADFAKKLKEEKDAFTK